jgi:hypothetical protein
VIGDVGKQYRLGVIDERAQYTFAPGQVATASINDRTWRSSRLTRSSSVRRSGARS